MKMGNGKTNEWLQKCIIKKSTMNERLIRRGTSNMGFTVVS